MSFSDSSLKDALARATEGRESCGTFSKIRSKISTGIELDSKGLAPVSDLEPDIVYVTEV